MIPVDMLVAHEGFEGGVRKGDCFRCCIASLLELPAEEVPHFMEDEPWLRSLQGWLRAQYNLWYFEIKDLPEYCFIYSGSPMYVTGGGQSPRGDWGHQVIYKIEQGKDPVLAHDPHPSRAGIVGEPEDFGFLVRINDPETIP